jgi:hypothetical protein
MEQPAATFRRNDALAAAAVTLIFTITVAVAILGQRPPPVVPATADPAHFSAERGLEHLHHVARAPHPIGSAENARVRDYLVGELERLGLQTTLHETIAVRQVRGVARVAAVQNIIARLPGSASTGAVALVSHYDSVPNAPGAADAGSGVVAILETLRALQSHPPLANDLVVLLTDGEEVGLMGAQAFADEHPLADAIGLILNFEARGVRGPSFLFQTSDGNGALIREVAAAAPHPNAGSLFPEIYRRLPNDTDLTVFLSDPRPFRGLNFAFIGGLTHYHAPIDAIDHLDLRSLQHHGEWALSLTRRFGAVDLRQLDASDRVFFTVPLFGIVHYPVAAALPLAVLALVGMILLLWLAVRRRAITRRGGLIGLAVSLTTLILVPLVIFGVWRLISLMHSDYVWLLHGDLYNSAWYVAGLSFLAVAVALLTAGFLIPRVSAFEIALAPLLVWSILNVVVAASLPGASYLLTWPLIAALLSTALLLPAPQSHRRQLLAAVVAAPSFFLIMPLVWLLPGALGMATVAGAIALMVLLLLLLTAPLEPLLRNVRFVVPLALVIAGICFLTATLRAPFTPDAPRPDSLVYLLDADEQRALWVSFDPEPTDFTRSFLGDSPAREPLDRYRIMTPGRPPMQSDAPLLPLPLPELRLIAEQEDGESRRLLLEVRSPRGAERMSIINVSPDVPITAVEVAGRTVSPSPSGAVMAIFALPADGLRFEITVPAGTSPLFRLSESSYGLPRQNGKPVGERPPGLMASNVLMTDMTVVQRLVQIGATPPEESGQPLQ